MSQYGRYTSEKLVVNIKPGNNFIKRNFLIKPKNWLSTLFGKDIGGAEFTIDTGGFSSFQNLMYKYTITSTDKSMEDIAKKLRREMRSTLTRARHVKKSGQLYKGIDYIKTGKMRYKVGVINSVKNEDGVDYDKFVNWGTGKFNPFGNGRKGKWTFSYNGGTSFATTEGQEGVFFYEKGINTSMKYFDSAIKKGWKV